MLFVCIMLLFFLLIFANDFCFHALSWFIDTVFLFIASFCIMRSAFNLLVFPSSMFNHFGFCLFYFYERAMCSP